MGLEKRERGEAFHEVGDGLLLDWEREELLSALCPTGSVDDFERQCLNYLQRRGALTDWELQRRRMGDRHFTLQRHRIIAPIQTGDTYHVFEAQHLFTGRIDVVKVLRRDKVTSALVASHLRRARIQSSVESAHLVRLYDARYARATHYIVNERVSGTDLLRSVMARGPLSVTRAAACGIATALALDAIHARGLIHGALRPTKVLVGDTGSFKLADVGTAEPPGVFDFSRNSHLVRADYLPPEAIRCERVTAVSDIYLLGCVLYLAVTGVAPFPGGTGEQKAHAHCTSEPVDPREICEGIDGEFIEALREMMTKDPSARMHSMRDVAARLEQWALISK